MFDRPSTPTIVYKYDIIGEPECDVVGFVEQQLGLARGYRNRLLNAEIRGRQEYRELRRTLYPEYMRLEEEFQAADARAKELACSIKARNASERRKRCSVEESTELAAARQERKGASEALREMRATVKVDARLAEASNTVKGELQATAKGWANAEGLYQATARKVEEAVFQAAKTSKGDPEFRRWDGSGRLAVQLQHPVGRTPATWSNIGVGKWDTILTVQEETVTHIGTDENGASHSVPRMYHTFSIRLGSDAKKRPVWVRCKVFLHRRSKDFYPWPDDAMVKWVEVVRRRVGRGFTYSVCFQLARKEGWEKPCGNGVVAVDVGWRLVEDGLRVAYWVGDDGDEGQIVIPHSTPRNMGGGFSAGSLCYIAKARDLQAIRDKHLDATKAEFVRFASELDELPPRFIAALERVQGRRNADGRRDGIDFTGAGGPARFIAWISLIRSKNRILDLVNLWGGDEQVDINDDGDVLLDRSLEAKATSIWPALAEWRGKDVHLERWETNVRVKFESWRKDFYRNFWATMRKKYGTVIVEKLDLAEMRQRRGVTDNRSDSGMIDHRNTAAAGLLLGLCSGMKIVRVTPENTTASCWVCGGLCEWDQAQDLAHTCEHCGAIWDQDFNAARNLMAMGAARMADVPE